MVLKVLKIGSLCTKVDAIVSSVNRMGVFADVGPLPVFVSNQVGSIVMQDGRHETKGR